MNKVVLKSIYAENFATFAEPIKFTTEIDFGKKEYYDNVFSENNTSFNKVSFLYGANGSGKTYFCKIIREIQRLIDWSPLTATSNLQFLSLPQFKGIDAAVPTFRFDVNYINKPTCFGIELIINEVTYYYEFHIKEKNIVYELLTKKVRRTEKILERISPSNRDIVLRSELKSFEPMKNVVKENALCLPVAALLNNDLATTIVEAIQEIQVVNMTAKGLAPNNSENAFSDERIEKYLDILKVADPTIRDLKISLEEEEVIRQKIESDDFENRELIAKKTKVGIQTKHAVFNEGIEMDSTDISFFKDESLGTVKLFTTLPYLFDALETGGTLVIDEIENGLHLSLTKELINLFINKESNPYNAQLICTSHQPLLVDGDFRRDQIWITTKDTYGRSILQRLSDFKTSRSKYNISNRIVEGVFGCNPEKFFK